MFVLHTFFLIFFLMNIIRLIQSLLVLGVPPEICLTSLHVAFIRRKVSILKRFCTILACIQSIPGADALFKPSTAFMTSCLVIQKCSLLGMLGERVGRFILYFEQSESSWLLQLVSSFGSVANMALRGSRKVCPLTLESGEIIFCL